jgi:ABC-type Fe3+-hydroxamate transport system substrate-binding protein
VSLVPSITELVVDMGLGAYLVGRTGFCIHPAHAVSKVPKVGGTKNVNLAKIKKLRATHVIVNIDENELPTVDALRQFVPCVIVTHPRAPQDNLALIDQLIECFADSPIDSVAMQQKALELKQLLKDGLARLAAKPRQRERVLYLIWRDPWMTVARDTYISQMLQTIGWLTWPDIEGGDRGAGRYPQLQEGEPWLAGIERVLLSSEPYRFGAEHVAQVQAWLPHAKVQLVDGELLNWYGSRAIQGLAYLAELAAGVAESPASLPN